VYVPLSFFVFVFCASTFVFLLLVNYYPLVKIFRSYIIEFQTPVEVEYRGIHA